MQNEATNGFQIINNCYEISLNLISVINLYINYFNSNKSTCISYTCKYMRGSTIMFHLIDSTSSCMRYYEHQQDCDSRTVVYDIYAHLNGVVQKPSLHAFVWQ